MLQRWQQQQQQHCRIIIIFLLLLIGVLIGDGRRRQDRFLTDLWHAKNKQPWGGGGTTPTTSWRRCECGRENVNFLDEKVQARIINGTVLSPHQYPWMALILYRNNFVCGATLINDYYVLTAAHCLPASFAKDDLKLLLGQYNNCLPNSDTVTLSITSIIRHPAFNSETFAYDIALMRLNMRVTYTSTIAPICLPPARNYNYQQTAFEAYKGRVGLIAGWGATSADNPSSLSCVPRQVDVPILTRAECANNSQTLFCAGYLNGFADSCQGDSGGPLQLKNKFNRYELIGVISSGEGCALPDFPGLYTDVLQLLNWINGNVHDQTLLCAGYQL